MNAGLSMKKKIYLTKKDLANRWNLSIGAISRYMRDGIIPYLDLSRGKRKRGTIRFRLDDIERHEKLCEITPNIKEAA